MATRSRLSEWFSQFSVGISRGNYISCTKAHFSQILISCNKLNGRHPVNVKRSFSKGKKDWLVNHIEILRTNRERQGSGQRRCHYLKSQLRMWLIARKLITELLFAVLEGACVDNFLSPLPRGINNGPFRVHPNSSHASWCCFNRWDFWASGIRFLFRTDHRFSFMPLILIYSPFERVYFVQLFWEYIGNHLYSSSTIHFEFEIW